MLLVTWSVCWRWLRRSSLECWKGFLKPLKKIGCSYIINYMQSHTILAIQQFMQTLSIPYVGNALLICQVKPCSLCTRTMLLFIRWNICYVNLAWPTYTCISTCPISRAGRGCPRKPKSPLKVTLVIVIYIEWSAITICDSVCYLWCSTIKFKLEKEGLPS